MKQGRQAKNYNMEGRSFMCCSLKSEGWKEKQGAFCGISNGLLGALVSQVAIHNP